MVHAAAVHYGSPQQNSVVGKTLLMCSACRLECECAGRRVSEFCHAMSVCKDDGQSNAVFECFRLIRSHGFWLTDVACQWCLPCAQNQGFG
uniref:Uncharacterized protein n=1 Tax=Aegilops tauschii subsp. strangulata TaxID=200361 RepID=A0A453SZK9_AEGTS